MADLINEAVLMRDWLNSLLPRRNRNDRKALKTQRLVTGPKFVHTVEYMRR